jgi:SynChlorMet cassette protein ScmD
MTDISKPIANPTMVFREEFDDWAVLFDPDSGEAYGLDPVGAFIWKRLDGNHTLTEIIEELRAECEGGLPEEAPGEITTFIEKLQKRGYASCS